jgi:AcrR family transcriptional regulator
VAWIASHATPADDIMRLITRSGVATSQQPDHAGPPLARAGAESARERILDAACARIASDGIDDVRIARIAQDAGVSPALVHYHFDTRERLLAEALEHSFERAGDSRIGGAPGTTPTHPGDLAAAERLAAMVDQCLPSPGPLEQDWVLWVELWLRAVRHPELRPVAEDLYARMHDWFVAVIAEGVRTGEFARCDPDEVADRALALIDGFGVRALLRDSAIPLERARAAVESGLAADLGLGERLVPRRRAT